MRAISWCVGVAVCASILAALFVGQAEASKFGGKIGGGGVPSTISGDKTFSGAITVADQSSNKALNFTAGDKLCFDGASNCFGSFSGDVNGVISLGGSFSLGGNDVVQTANTSEFSNNGSNLGFYVNDAEGLCVGNGTGDQTIPSECDGKVISATPGSLLSIYPNGLLTAITMGGARVTQAFTVTGLTKYVSVASSNTAANTVWTVSDGTNTCTITFACNANGVAGTLDTGTKFVAAVNGAGTGCVYAANANLTLAVTTQGCGTAATVKNATLLGKWQ